MTLHRLRHRTDRAALARGPDRPPVLSLIQPQIDMARQAGVTVDVVDERHVKVNYDARDREAWLAVDELSDAVRGRSTIEGDWSFTSAPDNWLIIHFDFGACRRNAGP